MAYERLALGRDPVTGRFLLPKFVRGLLNRNPPFVAIINDEHD